MYSNLLAEKRPHSHLTPSVDNNPFEFLAEPLTPIAADSDGDDLYSTLCRFDIKPVCDGQIDRQTDGRTFDDD